MSGPAPDTGTNWIDGRALPRFRELRERRVVDERMDDPDIDPDLLVRALKGIRRINVMSAAAPSLWPVIRNRAARGPIRVLDLACGSGDVTIALARRARRANTPVTFEGCDISSTAVRFAQDTARGQEFDIRFFEHDAIRDELPDGYDVIYSSLFLHHLATPQATRMLRKMALAAPLIIVNDLVRSRAGLLLAYAGCHVLTRSPVVHFDGPSSVAAAFTIPEMRAVADGVGLSGYALKWKWPFRFLLTHSRDGEQ